MRKKITGEISRIDALHREDPRRISVEKQRAGEERENLEQVLKEAKPRLDAIRVILRTGKQR
jgi:hypothetical protein